MTDQLAELYKDYKNGYLLRDAQVGAVRAFTLTGLFPKVPDVPTKKVTVINSTPLDKFVDKTGKIKKIAKGAEARRIIGKAETAGGLVLTHSEIEYVIENEDLIEPTFDLRGEVQAMAYVVGMDAETAVHNIAVANAQLAPESSNIHGNWDDANSDFETVSDDIVEFEATGNGTPYSLNWFAYGNRADTILTKKISAKVENWQIPQNEFTLQNTKNFLNARHFYGGFTMDDPEILGGDINNPGLKVVYKKYTNPGVKEAPLPEGLSASFAPSIKMLMYDTSDKDTEPKTIIKVAAAVGAYPVQKGAGLFKYSDILS